MGSILKASASKTNSSRKIRREKENSVEDKMNLGWYKQKAVELRVCVWQLHE